MLQTLAGDSLETWLAGRSTASLYSSRCKLLLDPMPLFFLSSVSQFVRLVAYHCRQVRPAFPWFAPSACAITRKNYRACFYGFSLPGFVCAQVSTLAFLLEGWSHGASCAIARAGSALRVRSTRAPVARACSSIFCFLAATAFLSSGLGKRNSTRMRSRFIV